MSQNDANSPTRYTFDQLIGRGGMGEVWLGHSKLAGGLSRKVAIKRIISTHAHDDAMRQQFLIEAQASLGLRHENIVFVFDYLQIEGQDCLVMEWVQGVNAAELLTHLRNNGPWPVPQDITVYVALCILRALDYTHNLKTDPALGTGLIHRDVSPQNILISIQGDVKLSDFGVARLSDAATTIGGPKGKIAYMAPEQFHRKHDKRVDLYSVGAVLYEMLTGHRYQYFGGETPEHSEDEPILEALANEQLDPRLSLLVAQLLRQLPARRLGEAHDALALLREHLAIREPEVKAKLSSLIAAAYDAVQSHQKAHPPVLKKQLPSDVASSLIAHQILDETARSASSTPAQTPTEQSERITCPERPKPQKLQAWAPAITIVLTTTLAFGTAWNLGIFGSTKTASPPSPSVYTGSTAPIGRGSTSLTKASAQGLPPPSSPGRAIAKAKQTSIESIDALLKKDPQPPSKAWDKLQALLAFNLRLTSKGSKRLNTRWVSGCKPNDGPASGSCRAAIELLSDHQREKVPHQLNANPFLDTPPSAQVILDRALTVLMTHQVQQDQRALDRVLASALTTPRNHALDLGDLETNALRANGASIPGQFTQSGWQTGIRQALCQAAQSRTTPEWEALHLALQDSQKKQIDPLLRLYQVKRDQAWSTFLASLQPKAVSDLGSLRKLLGSPSSPDLSFARKILDLLKIQGALALTGCPVFANTQDGMQSPELTTQYAKSLERAFDTPLKAITKSPRGQSYLQAQAEALEIINAQSKAQGSRETFTKGLRKSVASVPKLSDADFEGGESLDKILRFPAEQALAWSLVQDKQGLRQSWCAQVYRPFLSNLAGRYPFARQARKEVKLKVLKQYLHPKHGEIWRFVAQQKENISQRQGRFIATAQAKEMRQALGPEALEFLNRAWRLARALYPNGAQQARVSFAVELPLGGSFSRATWSSRTKMLELSTDQTTRKELTWPRDFGSSSLQLTFTAPRDPKLSPFKVKTKPGVWSLFRLLDQGYVLSDRGRQFTLLWSSRRGQPQEKLRFRVLREPSPFFGERGYRTRFLKSFAFVPPARPIAGRPRCD